MAAHLSRITNLRFYVKMHMLMMTLLLSLLSIIHTVTTCMLQIHSECMTSLDLMERTEDVYKAPLPSSEDGETLVVIATKTD